MLERFQSALPARWTTWRTWGLGASSELSFETVEKAYTGVRGSGGVVPLLPLGAEASWASRI